MKCGVNSFAHSALSVDDGDDVVDVDDVDDVDAVDGADEVRERFEEAMIIFEFVIDKFLKINELDSLELGGVKSSLTFNELLKSTGLKRAGSR